MNEAYKNITNRRSIKKYSTKKVEHEIIEKIVEAGQCAPSGMNRQSYAFVVVEKEEILSELSKMNADVMHADMDPFYGAQALIVVFADSNVPTHIYDGSLAMANLMLAANSLGVDSCWIHRAKEMFESEKGKELMKEWGLPESYVGIGNCILGYRSQEPTKRSERTSKVIYA